MKLAFVAAVALAVVVPAALEATPITIYFTGTPTLTKGVFASEMAVIVYGSFTYDSDAVDSRIGLNRDKFESTFFPPGRFGPFVPSRDPGSHAARKRPYRAIRVERPIPIPFRSFRVLGSKLRVFTVRMIAKH